MKLWGGGGGGGKETHRLWCYETPFKSTTKRLTVIELN